MSLYVFIAQENPLTLRLAETADRLQTDWFALVQRRAPWVIAAALALTVAALVVVVSGLRIDTDTEGMIAPDTPFMQTYRAYKNAFPILSDSITVVVEADTPDRARDATKALAEAMVARPEVFESIYAPAVDPFFARNGLLYSDRADLLDLLDSIADAQPLLQRLRGDTSLRGLFAVLDLAANDVRTGAGDTDDLNWLFGRIAAVIDDRLAGGPALLSWEEILSGEESTPEDRRGIIVVRPAALDFDSLMPGGTALDEIRALARDVAPGTSVHVSLTGDLALAHDELEAVRAGASLAGWVSLVLVAAILGFGLRSPRLVAASLITLISGLIWTAGFAALAIGSLNMISVAFAVLFVSLGIDFSVHICLRLRESGRGASAVSAALRAVAGSLALCALSTAVGFYAFVPTDFSGVAELGLIAGTGMGISLVANLSLLPALLSLPPFRPRSARVGKRVTDGWRHTLLLWPERNRRLVLGGALIVAAAAAVAAPGARFDFNPVNLQDPDAGSVVTLRRLMAEGTRDMWAAALKVADAEASSMVASRMAALDTVDHVVTLADLVPDGQNEKREIIADIAFLTEPDAFSIAGSDPPDAAAQLAALRGFSGTVADIVATDTPAGVRALDGALGRLLDTAVQDPAVIAFVEAGLVGALPGRLEALDESLQAGFFGVDDLPSSVRDRFQGPGGAMRVQIHPAEDIAADNDALRRFVADMRTVDADVTGAPVILLEAGRTVIGAFVQALVTAAVIIIMVLWVVTRRLASVAVILAPLALAALVTAALAVAFGLAFNFANIIVLPLILGIGVDSAIHLHYRRIREPDKPLLASATARAVWVSALTTIAGFGSLALSPHRGMASLGLLLMIGVGATLLCTTLLLPALLPAREPSR